jgi:uroporphyrinogen decarboxylase
MRSVRPHVAPAATALLEAVADLGVPRIAFGVGTGHLLESIAATGPDAIGLDWRTPLPEARRRLGPAMPLQGNLDPAALLAPWSVAREAAAAVLASAPGQGHVFNLGHGVLPDTPPDVPGRIVELAHEQAQGLARAA